MLRPRAATSFLVFFVMHSATTELYPLSLPTLFRSLSALQTDAAALRRYCLDITEGSSVATDRKSTRLNSSHLGISDAVFCLKKKSTAVLGDADDVGLDHRDVQDTIEVVPALREERR